MPEHGTYIDFVDGVPKPKTKVWHVCSREDGLAIGTVQWFGRWRKYSFFPTSGMVFEQTCLREIADFIEKKTKDYRSH